MKILILTDLYPPHYVGGYELRCKETADELTTRGHELTVLTSCWGIEQPEIDKNTYRLLNYDPTSDLNIGNGTTDLFRMNRRTNQIRWAIQCRQNYRITSDLLRKIKPDVVYVWNMCHVGINPVLAAQDLGIPTVFTLGIDWLSSIKHDLFGEKQLLKRKYRQIMLGFYDFNRLDTRHLITISNALKRAYLENGFKEQDITVIPRGIPSEIIIDSNHARLMPADGKVHLIFVGRVCPEKAPDVAIKAIALLGGKIGDRDIQLDIIGTGQDTYINELKELTKSLKLDANIRFMGRLEHKKILAYYPTYDALIFPSRWEEPLGVVALEAMARGLPVIATDRGGIPEIVIDGHNGLLIPADQPQALAAAITQLVQVEGLAERLGREAVNTIRQKFALEVIVDQILDYFSNVLKEDESPISVGSVEKSGLIKEI